MSHSEKPIRIVDARNKEKFVIDDIYLNGYARFCGISATGVYVSLCRHANKNQQCFPSKRLIAIELGITERTVYSAVKILEAHHIISTQKTKAQSGKFASLIYTLIDKSQWQSLPSATIAVGKIRQSPTANNDSHQRQPLPCKELTDKELTDKDIATQGASSSASQEAPPLSPEKTKRDNDIHHLVRAFKMLVGVDSADRSWDKVNFARYCRSSKTLLEIFAGDKGRAADCMVEVYQDLHDKKGLSVTFETILKHAHDWRNKNGNQD